MTWQLKEYRKNLSKPNENHIFLLPWGGVVCRNCDENGELVSYNSVASYRDGDKPLWLVLSLVLFRENVSYLGYPQRIYLVVTAQLPSKNKFFVSI